MHATAKAKYDQNKDFRLMATVFLVDANESITSGRDRNNSVVMEDVDELVATGQRSADQPRTVSISSYDL